MKKILFMTLSLLMFSQSYASASVSADEVIKEVILNIEKQEQYKVKIEVILGNDSLLGYYEVANDTYYLNIEGQELFGASGVKYEVYKDRKEVVIDSVSPDVNGNILANPAAAFSSIAKDFKATVLSNKEGVTTIYLEPIGEVKESIDSATLDVDNSTMLPTSLRYEIEGEVIEIKIVSIEPVASIREYEPSAYAEYEIIDFR